MNIHLPSKVNYIINKLMTAGFEAYAVGGCVRDSLLGRIPDDWDITTSALPQEVKQLFPRTVDTGIQHGTVTVMLEKEGFEVTTYRIDGEYEDNRHPKEVCFTGNLIEDLKRRDFTINAMAYNESHGLIDEFGGILDLEKRKIRCVGNPKERFLEDALRIMRAIRFSAQLGYEMEENTKRAMQEMAASLSNISAERIQTELVKLLTSPNPDSLRIAYEIGITKVVLPEFDCMMETKQHNPHHCYSVGEHTLKALECIAPDKVLRLALLFHDSGKPETISVDGEGIDHFYGHGAKSEEIAGKVLKRLRFDNRTSYLVEKLVFYHDYKIELSHRGMRRAVQKIGEDIFPELFRIKEADIKAQSNFQKEKKEEELKKCQELYDEMVRNQDCVSLKTLAVDGRDLIAMGVKPGREIGEILKELLELVVEHPEKNQKEYLLEAAVKFVQK